MTDDEPTTETTDEQQAEAQAPADTAATETTEDQAKLADATSGGNAYTDIDRPASGASAGDRSGGAATVSATPPIDIDSQLNAKDLLIDKYASGLITAEDYAQETAKIDKQIVKAQRELAKPAQQVQQTYQQQEAAKAYWQNWGKGTDIAQKIGKAVRGDRAAALYAEAMAEVQANPRYQGRKEFDANSIAYDRWLDKLEAEAKKKPAAGGAAAGAGTRVSGDRSVPQTGQPERRRTAREKLEAGEYHFDE